MRIFLILLAVSFVLYSCQESEKENIEGLWLHPVVKNYGQNYYHLFTNIGPDSIEFVYIGDRFASDDFNIESHFYSRDNNILVIKKDSNSYDSVDLAFSYFGSLELNFKDKEPFQKLIPICHIDSFISIDLIGKTYFLQEVDGSDTISFLENNIAIIKNSYDSDWKTIFYRSLVYQNNNIIYLEEGRNPILVVDFLKDQMIYCSNGYEGKNKLVLSECKNDNYTQQFIGTWQTTYNWDPKYFDASEEWIEEFNAPEYLKIFEDSIVVVKNNIKIKSTWKYLSSLELLAIKEPERLLKLKSISTDSLVVNRTINHIQHEIIYHRISEAGH